MIRLTDESNRNILVAPEHVMSIKPASTGSGLKIADGYVIVTESPQEVARKVLLFKLAKSDYANGNENVKETARLALMDLAELDTGGTIE